MHETVNLPVEFILASILQPRGLWFLANCCNYANGIIGPFPQILCQPRQIIDWRRKEDEERIRNWEGDGYTEGPCVLNNRPDLKETQSRKSENNRNREFVRSTN